LVIEDLPKPIAFSFNEKLSDLSDLPEKIRSYAKYAYKKDVTTWICINFDSLIQDFKN